ncbi:putative RNase toxin 44 of polymorphic toxin system [Stackebrandtia albiflava]|uniref:Putative RNase toxin 44 of polymorphic toxin system n=1 Tax=Stackebrandtia albiflava TaxID=406432 RepID=A0A562UYL6_9ACTN|nr:polymorphic toxin type 44 domain-containing protein [Stackebrandtia albiflava]TWJ10693.1 putative RNase toxin 44 of polymorphic toxin system [Stackebrandtia albiflava]
MEYSQLRDADPSSLTSVAAAWRKAGSHLNDAGDGGQKALDLIDSPGWKGTAAENAVSDAKRRVGTVSGGSTQAGVIAKILSEAVDQIAAAKARLESAVAQAEADENLSISGTGRVTVDHPAEWLTLLPGVYEMFVAGPKAKAARLNRQISEALAAAERIDTTLAAAVRNDTKVEWNDSEFNRLSRYILTEMRLNPTSVTGQFIKAMDTMADISLGMLGFSLSTPLPHVKAGIAGITAFFSGAKYGAFAHIVWPGNDWDHKPDIKEILHAGKDIENTDVEVPGTDYKVRGDIWSNIHFGYVGKSLGFTDVELETGADLADYMTNGTPQPPDRLAVQLGIDLYEKYPDGQLTQQQLMAEIKGKLDEIHRSERHGPDTGGKTMVEKIPGR